MFSAWGSRNPGFRNPKSTELNICALNCCTSTHAEYLLTGYRAGCKHSMKRPSVLFTVNTVHVCNEIKPNDDLNTLIEQSADLNHTNICTHSFTQKPCTIEKS